LIARMDLRSRREKENVDGTVGEDLPRIGAIDCELTSPLVGMKCRFLRRHFLDQVGDTLSRDLVSDKRQQPTMARDLVVDFRERFDAEPPGFRIVGSLKNRGRWASLTTASRLNSCGSTTAPKRAFALGSSSTAYAATMR